MNETKDRVVCISETGMSGNHPKKGEICTIAEVGHPAWCHPDMAYVLIEYEFNTIGNRQGFNSCNFRDVDTTFGHAVTERIEQQIEYQEALNQI